MPKELRSNKNYLNCRQWIKVSKVQNNNNNKKQSKEEKKSLCAYFKQTIYVQRTKNSKKKYENSSNERYVWEQTFFLCFFLFKFIYYFGLNRVHKYLKAFIFFV